MTQKALKLRAEVSIHSVSCPGVFFQCKGPVHLSICFLGFHVKTKPFPPSFPLLFHDKFMFEKTFATCLTLDHLQGALTADNVYMELLQETADHQDVVLATFETSARELLFPYPQLRGPYCSGVDVDLLMEPTKDFPGIISPKIEASTRTNIDETRHPDMDAGQDSAHVVSDSPPPIHKHPHLRPRSRDRNTGQQDDKEVFAWRKFSDSLIHRGNKWHTMHDKPGQDRPKSAGLARMESDSSTERDRDHQQSHQQSHHHHQHRSRPRSRARFGANNKHRAHSYTGPRRSGSERPHHPAGPPHIPPPGHGLPPHNDLHHRGHSPPCRDTDPVPPPCPATPHHPATTPQRCPPTPFHGPPTPHHGPPTPHHGPPTPHHGPPTPHHGPPPTRHGPTPPHCPSTPHHGPLASCPPPHPAQHGPVRCCRGCQTEPLPTDFHPHHCYENFNKHKHCRAEFYSPSHCNACNSYNSCNDCQAFYTCQDSFYNASCHAPDFCPDSGCPAAGPGCCPSSSGNCGWNYPAFWPPGPHLHSSSLHH